MFQYIYWKKSAYQWTHAVQTHVAQGPTVFELRWDLQSIWTSGEKGKSKISRQEKAGVDLQWVNKHSTLLGKFILKNKMLKC